VDIITVISFMISWGYIRLENKLKIMEKKVRRTSGFFSEVETSLRGTDDDVCAGSGLVVLRTGLFSFDFGDDVLDFRPFLFGLDEQKGSGDESRADDERVRDAGEPGGLVKSTSVALSSSSSSSNFLFLLWDSCMAILAMAALRAVAAA
jgi:hypothetical protein